MKMSDRMLRGGPLWKAMYTRINELINGHNELVRIILQGQNPHEANDTTNLITATTAIDLESVIELGQDLITEFEAHLADTDAHLAADTTNVVTELGVPEEIYALLNELKVDYEAHRVLTAGSVHSGTDTTNTVTAADATTKALAITLANDLRTQFIANYANVTSHHGADGSGDAPTESALTGTATWTEIATLADDLRTSYEAHRVNTTGGIHGGADSTNTVSAGAVGTVQDAVNAGLNELKDDFNAHILESGTSHVHTDLSMQEDTANASSLATSLALANSLATNYTEHISRADEVTTGPIVATLDEE